MQYVSSISYPHYFPGGTQDPCGSAPWELRRRLPAFRACIHIIEDRVKGFAEVAVLPTVAERAEKLKALGAQGSIV